MFGPTAVPNGASKGSTQRRSLNSNNSVSRHFEIKLQKERPEPASETKKGKISVSNLQAGSKVF